MTQSVLKVHSIYGFLVDHIWMEWSRSTPKLVVVGRTPSLFNRSNSAFMLLCNDGVGSFERM